MIKNRKHLSAEMSRLRKEDPVVWALIRGRGGSSRIALLLGCSFATANKALEKLREEGVVDKSSKQDSWYFRRDSELYKEYMELRDYNIELELEIVTENLQVNPTSKYPPGLLSNAAEERLKANPPTVLEYDEIESYFLSDAQWHNLQVIRDNFKVEEVFASSTYQDIRHTSRLDYSRNELRALVKKGFVKFEAMHGGKGEHWSLTLEGMNYAHVPITRLIQKTITAGVDKSSLPTRVKVSPERQVLGLLENAAGGMTTQDVAEGRKISRSAAHRQLTRLLEAGKVRRQLLPDGSNKWWLS